MLFVWAFSSDTNVNKANYAKAILMFAAIIFGLYMLIVIAVLGIAAGASH